MRPYSQFVYEQVSMICPADLVPSPYTGTPYIKITDDLLFISNLPAPSIYSITEGQYLVGSTRLGATFYPPAERQAKQLNKWTAPYLLKPYKGMWTVEHNDDRRPLCYNVPFSELPLAPKKLITLQRL